MTILAAKIAMTLQAIKNCRETGNILWEENHGEALEELMERLPTGSGFDTGTVLLEDECDTDKLVFSTSYHHMDEDGYYTEWTEHKITATPSFVGGINLDISGEDINEIYDYMGELFHQVLTEEV